MVFILFSSVVAQSGIHCLRKKDLAFVYLRFITFQSVCNWLLVNRLFVLVDH